MNWLISLRDQLPLLLVLSPVVGFLVTLSAIKRDRETLRYLAALNVALTLLILAVIAWQWEVEHRAELSSIRASISELVESGDLASSESATYESMQKRRVDRLRGLLFVVDGINLWPALMLIVVTGLVVWRAGESVAETSDGTQPGSMLGLVPLTLLFEAAALAALTAYDVRALLTMLGIAAIAMSLLIGFGGGPDRRRLAERFLVTQLAGCCLIACGLAMLTVDVAWMKIDGSPKLPLVRWDIGTLAFDIQYWGTRYDYSLHYANGVFPWTLFLMSLGFAVQFGLFPFHAVQVAAIGTMPRKVAALFLVGTLPLSAIGWFRFVLPLALDQLAGMDWLILVPAVGGAIWGAIRAYGVGDPRQQAAYLLLSLFGVAVLGCYSFTRFGAIASWLMIQQLVAASSAVLLMMTSPERDRLQVCSFANPISTGFSMRTVLLFLGVTALGLMGSASIILVELLRESFWLPFCIPLIGFVIARVVFLLLNRHQSATVTAALTVTGRRPMRPEMAVVLLAVMANGLPFLLIHQCEPEFARAFRRFEPSSVEVAPADPATDRQ